MTMPIVDFWYDFASTYSYPAALRIEDLARSKGVAVRWRPFLLGPIFAGFGWRDSPFNLYPEKGQYMLRDLTRICGGLGIPFAKPEVFPQKSLLAARVALALPEGERARFSRAVYTAQFGQGRLIFDPATILDVLGALDLPADALERAETEEVKDRLRAESNAAKQVGLIGAPSFVTAGGEMFWGNDRLEVALDWALQEIRSAA